MLNTTNPVLTITTTLGYWLCPRCDYVFNPAGKRYIHLLDIHLKMTESEYRDLLKKECEQCKGAA